MDVWHWLVGQPLKANQAQSEEISTPEGLAALSLDALSSVAYGPEAIAVVLVAAGAASLPLLMPITIAIVGLLAILVLSYSQVIEAYPGGGGAYTVSRENLGRGASHLAAAALIVDYVLTVAVSIAAGVAALTSAFPVLLPYTLWLCLLLLAIITVLNLRGVGESARAFLLPTMIFIVGTLAMIAVGLIRGAPATSLPHGVNTTATLYPLGILLILKAFASGCSALTGVEAIANGVPLFRTPRVVRAKRTEWLLGVILGAMLLGIAFLTVRFHIQPVSQQTMLSEVTVASLGHGAAYYTLSLATTAVLGLAANTSFGGLPLLASILSKDHYLPHVFSVRGDRLVFQYGIWVLAVAAAVLLVAANGNTLALIPLYAIGVFTGFTLSQTGMVVHWIRTKPPGWAPRASLNGLGALATGVSTLVFIWSKFSAGAWVVVITIPLLILMFRRISTYYTKVGKILGIGQPLPPVTAQPRPVVIVPFSGLSKLTTLALSEALGLSDDVLAVTVLFEPNADEAAVRLEQEWKQWNPPARLVMLRSQYSSVVRPILRFVNSVERHGQQRVLVLIPEIVPGDLGHDLLHNQIGTILANALRKRTDVLVGVIPLHTDAGTP